MSLPTLPAHTISGPPGTGVYFSGHTDAAMQAYGQQCRAAGLEEAALFISGGSFLHDQSPVKMWANQLAPKIRSLK